MKGLRLSFGKFSLRKVLRTLPGAVRSVCDKLLVSEMQKNFSGAEAVSAAEKVAEEGFRESGESLE